MDDFLNARPTLAAWLAEYEAIGRDYVGRLRSLGIDFAEEGACAEAERGVRERLRAKGAAFRNGGASVVSGALSSACVACTGGCGSKTFTFSTACNRSCYFCFNANQADYDATRALKEGWREELDEFLTRGDVTHVALTGGEPLLHPDEAVEFFGRVRAAHPDAHTRLYTAGDFLDEALLGRLAEAGLSELRLSVKLDALAAAGEQERAVANALECVRLAKRFVPDVMVEMPAIPGTGEAMRRLLCGLDEAGAFGVNLLELGFPMTDWSEFSRRDFEVANPPFSVLYDYGYAAGLPIAGSGLLCLELLEFAVDQGLSLGVHYCSLENKHRDQVLQQNRAVRLDPRIWELDDGDLFYKAAKVFDGDARLVGQRLAELGLPFEEDAEEGSVTFALRHVEALAGEPVLVALSTNVVEEQDGQMVVRELKLELLEEAGSFRSASVWLGGGGLA